MLKPEQPPELAAKEDKALLVIIRDTYFGGAIVFWNYLDDQFIGETMGNTYPYNDTYSSLKSSLIRFRRCDK